MSTSTRRGFLHSSLLGATALTAAGAAEKPNEKVTLAVVGLKNRGKDQLIAREFHRDSIPASANLTCVGIPNNLT